MNTLKSGNMATRAYQERRLQQPLAGNVKHFREMEETLSNMEDFAIAQSRVTLFGCTVVKGTIPPKLIEHRANIEELRLRLNASLEENGSEVRL